MEFLFAVARNDVEKVRSMLQSGIDVNSSFIWNSKDTYSPVIPSDIIHRPDLLSNLQIDQKYQCKPLNIAVLGGHPNMVRLLLSAGADINNKDGRGRTALVCAIYGLDLDASNINTSNLHLISQTNPSHFDIMKNILLCHPNLYYATLDAPQYEIKGITPLCLASYLGKADILQLLLEDGRVNVDGTDSKNATALMYAARDGNVPIVKMLLAYHASPDITDSHGWSAIQYAERNPEIVQLCEEVLRIKRSELVTSNNCTVNYPINYAKLSHLLCTIPNYPSSLSHLQFDTLKEIDHIDPSAAPLVHIVQSAFLQAIKIHDHHSLQTLLMKSPPLNGILHSGPLLINHHDPKTGLTAFHHAMRTKPLPSLDTITMLFQAGADMNSQTYYGRTALHHLARFGIDKDGQSWGIQKSSNGKDTEAQQPVPPPLPPSTLSSTGVNIPEHLAMCASLLIRFGSLVNIADPTGNTPLHFAAEFGGVPEVLEVLILEGGADLSLKNKKGLTPLDVCKSEDIKRRMIQLESERKHANKTKSVISSLSGTIRPFDSASEYNRSSVTRSVSRSTTVAPANAINVKSRISKVSASFLFCGDDSKQKLPMSKQKQLLMATIQRKKGDVSYEEYSDFEVILKAFFGYQTTFTDSIESSLAYITDSILGSWNMQQNEHVSTIQQLEKTITQLRFELREAHEMFDCTDQLVEKVMMSFREELEQVEQIHQADWEMSELQHDKIEKLFDVFERIDGRFCQLELAQDDLIGQIERLRKAAARKQQQLKMQVCEEEPADISHCVAHLSQSLLILQTVPIDQVLYLRDDRNRLYQDMTAVVEQVVQEIEVHLDQNKPDDKHTLTQAKALVQERWLHVKEVLTKTYPATADKTDEQMAQQQPHQLTRSISQPTTVRQKHTIMANIYSFPRKEGAGMDHPSLNQLELSFDILHSNLYEIQKDIEEVTEHLEKLMMSKKKMYELCLSLEKELHDPERTRTEDEIKSELSQLMIFTQQLFDKQHALDKERTQLLKEYTDIEQQLNTTRDSLHKVRPPALLQGLLDRLDTDETPCVRVEKDWKEDSNLVSEIVMDPQAEDDESCASSATSTSQQQEMQLTALQSKQLGAQCTSKLSTLCYIARLDASLYCLKVLASHAISKSRQHLLQVQASLGQASTDLDDTRNQMTQLYDDAAEVARQVFALKTELETIVRHRKEEVVKVWEVVDEVSEGVDAKAIQCQQQQQQVQSQKQPKSQQKIPLQVVADQGEKQQHHQQQDRIEEQDRHQWIIRELEQLQHVHESLQDAIDELKQEQAMIGQSLRQLASVFIEPQVDKLVGQDETSLLSVSDRLAELMDRVRDNEIGLRPTSMSLSSVMQQETEKNREGAASVPVKSNTTGVGPRIHPANKNTANNSNNRLSRLSAATNRLSASTYNSNRSSYYVRSPSSAVLDNANSSKRLSAAMSIRTDKKRMSIISATSLSSLSSYQQERMMARASNLSSVLSKVQQQKNSSSNKQITSRK
ncbi:uncharacterized protein ATC70_001345 [Mucor velutinosus]|uniref:Uncharacterized protein n=1 Tax=Mucor velutinosus TaxID=708070 RepID=A0AAN7DIA6_9FUNG|nr:hypothetical protein ATC70_001345 [Mucor velutinosus]